MATRENPTPRDTAPAAADPPARAGHAPVAARTSAPANPGVPVRATRSGAAAGGGVGRPAPHRPNPRPMRLAVAAGGVAALSALLATISTSAVPANASVVTSQTNPTAAPAIVQHVTRVVQLPPGVKAPANAGPNVVVTQLPAPVVKPRTVVVTTTQSGRVVKP
jgi:hypothetical protein